MFEMTKMCPVDGYCNFGKHHNLLQRRLRHLNTKNFLTYFDGNGKLQFLLTVIW